MAWEWWGYVHFLPSCFHLINPCLAPYEIFFYLQPIQSHNKNFIVRSPVLHSNLVVVTMISSIDCVSHLCMVYVHVTVVGLFWMVVFPVFFFVLFFFLALIGTSFYLAWTLARVCMSFLSVILMSPGLHDVILWWTLNFQMNFF